jgi:sugar phosphate isomerase/epimerase
MNTKSNMTAVNTQTRRSFCKRIAVGTAATTLSPTDLFSKDAPYRLRYILASSMYGQLPLKDILPEVHKTGAEHIDIWPLRHANQREQIEEMGHDRFADLLKKHNVKLGMLTHYDLGPFKLQPQMPFAKKFNAEIMIAGSGGPKGLSGPELKSAVEQFIEKMKPHIAAAETAGVTIGIENHANALIESPDAIRYLAEFAPSKHIGIALAPYHLPQDPKLLAKLIEDIGPGLAHFYAWQHGHGCIEKLPKDEEMLQMPGRGSLDFAPIMAALQKTNYGGWVSVFMHPVPRGIPILPTAKQVTDAINQSRRYLETCLAKA